MDERVRSLLLAILSDELTGSDHEIAYPDDGSVMTDLLRESIHHAVFPLVMDHVLRDRGGSAPELGLAKKLYRNEIIYQARKTAEFLLLYEHLCKKGLHPAVMKGIVLRDLYPEPEHRPSADEDLLIDADDFSAYHGILQDYGLQAVENGSDLENEYEVAYEDRKRGIYLELHKQLFPPDNWIYRNMSALFEGMSGRFEMGKIYGEDILTIGPTDHLLYMLCHAYKHFIHGGFGIRQVCDICMFSDRYGDRIDWGRIRRGCDSIRLSCFSAAIFRIGNNHLGFGMPREFSDIEIDETALLDDILTGGIYGVNDINRAHSANITIDAAVSQKKKRSVILSSLFLPYSAMAGRYPYLKKHRWLLPAAWIQRLLRYLLHREKYADPSESLRIGNDRVNLMKQYEIID